MHLEYEDQGRGMVFVAEGVLSGDELVRATARSYSEGGRRLRWQIIDLSGVERMDLTADQIRQVAELDREAAERCAGARIAIVAAHDLAVGISRLYCAYAQSAALQARVFPTQGEARAWLAAERPSPQAGI